MLLSQDNGSIKRDELLFDLVKRRYDSEWNRIKDLDGKATSFIGFVSVIIGLLLGSGTFNLSSALLHSLLSIPYFLGIGTLLISVIFSLRAIKIKKWNAVPNVKTLLNNYAYEPYSKVLVTTRDTMAEATLKIEGQNNSKATLITQSWYLLISGLATIFIFIIIFTISGVGVSKQ
jgi:hypothetical protein